MKDSKKDIHEEEVSEETLPETGEQTQDDALGGQDGITQSEEKDIMKLKDALARTQADYENFKKRTERDRTDMLGFLRADILRKILPRVDDMERMISGTPEDMRQWALYDGVIALQKALLKDLQNLWVHSFESKGNPVNPELHEVMTQIPGEEGIIVDEFEKGYMLADKVLRVAKVVVGNGNQ